VRSAATPLPAVEEARSKMRHVPALFLRELSSFFLGPMAYLVLLAFQLIAFWNFWELVSSLAQPQREFSNLRDPMSSYIAGSFSFWIALLAALPALTMRLVAEERRSGTIEPLLTLPIHEREVVAAKWLAGLTMYLAILAPFAIYLPFLYRQAGFHFDLGPVLGLAIGLTTLGMMMVAIGVFFSTITRNQLVAAIWSFATYFLLVAIVPLFYAYAVRERASWADSLSFLAVLNQIQGFAQGRLDLRVVLVHLSATGFMLYLATIWLGWRDNRV